MSGPDQARPVYAMLARVPVRGVGLFAEYEESVLSLLEKHGGTLVRRLRSADGGVELHLVTFPSDKAASAYRDDERRRAQRELLTRSGAVVELLELYDVASRG